MQASKKHAIAIGLALAYPGFTHAQMPGGGTVTAGGATISQPDPHHQIINQTTQKAVIDWQNFSIGAGNTVQIKQLGKNSVLLNRVVGNESSTILGRLTANGQVFLVNPYGVYFAAGSSVDVGGLVATALNIGNKDFLAGNYVFRGDGNAAARREVINEGVLKAREGGYVVLAGDYAANRGVIQAQLGTAVLASGNRMTLDIKGDSLINFAVNEKTVANLSGVENSGQVFADGGRAIMTAAVARSLAGTAVNNTGVIQAQSMEEHAGGIYLSASGGDTLSSGTLDARGTAAGTKGGTIQVLGDRVGLTGAARVDASGVAGGGKINIGGNYQGKGPLQNASDSYVGKDVKILANATAKGDGGNVVVWADGGTRYYGSIAAKGGAQGGNGGSVEVSGKGKLAFAGKVDTTAPKGKIGKLLLDPTDIEIVTSVDPATADMTTGTPFKDASNNGGTSRVSVGTIETALATSNVIVTTAGAGSAPKGGTITLDDGSGGGLDWSSANTLTLQANNTINIKSNINGANGSLVLEAPNGATQTSGTTITANGLLLKGGGTWDLGGINGSGYLHSYNKVNVLAADLSGGLLQYSSDKSFSIGTVAGVSGLKQTGGTTQLYADFNNASMTIGQNISTNWLLMRAAGGVSESSGSITANNASFAGGKVDLGNSSNRIGTISASISGPFNYKTDGTLTVGSGYYAGIATNNNNVTITTGDAAGYDPGSLPGKKADGTNNPASLTLNESVTAGSGNIVLTAGAGGVLQRADIDTSTQKPKPNGSLQGASLQLNGRDASKVTPFVLNNSNNSITRLAGKTNGSIYYAGSAVNIDTVGGVSGLTTTSNTLITASYVDPATGATIPAVYNANNISLSIGGDLHINKDIDASASRGSGSVSIGMGGDFTTDTASGVYVRGKSLAVVGNDSQGEFYLRTNVPALAASGGSKMVIDNSSYSGTLTALGIGTSATSVDVPQSQGGQNVSSTDTPVGDFYLTTAGALNVIKINSKGKNLLLRANSLNIVLDATTADDARIMLQPYNVSSTIGVNNENEPTFGAGINYSGDLLARFKNPVATFYFGTLQHELMNDASIPSMAKSSFSGDIHIGYDSTHTPGWENTFNLGYRSISAQTSGNMVVYGVGPLYNLRLMSPDLTLYGFNTFGNQIHLLTDRLTMPGTVANYKNPNKPEIVLRSLNDETMWVGVGLPSKPYEKRFLPADIVKLPDGSTIIVGGTTDYPFKNGGSGHGDIHITWDDGTPASMLGNRKLILSTTEGFYQYAGQPPLTMVGGGKRGGLWKGCQNLTVCQESNPNPDGGTGIDPGGPSNPGDGTDPGTTPPGVNPSNCPGCTQPTPSNPYPPDTTPVSPIGTPDDGNPTNGTPGDDNGDNGNPTPGDNGTPTDGGDGGGDTDPGGPGDGTPDTGPGDDGGNPSDTGPGNDGSPTDGGDNGGNTSPGDNDGTNGNGDGSNGDGNGSQTDGDGGAGTGPGGNGDGDGSSAGGDGGNGDGNANNGDNGAGTGNNNNGDGDGGNGGGGNGDGSGSQTDGDGGAGTGPGGNGDGDGSSAGGDGGNGDGNANNGDNGAGTGNNNNGDGDGGNGGGGNGDGSGSQTDGDGGAGTGSGGNGDGDGSPAGGDGGNGDGNANNGEGTGNNNEGDGGSGTGGGSNTDGNGDGGAGTGSGGNGDGSSNDGDGGNGDGNGNNGDNGAGNGSGADADADGGGGNGDGSNADGNGDSGAGNGSGGNGDGSANDGDGSNGDGNGSGGDLDGDSGSANNGDGTGNDGDSGAGKDSGGPNDGNGSGGNDGGDGNGDADAGRNGGGLGPDDGAGNGGEGDNAGSGDTSAGSADGGHGDGNGNGDAPGPASVDLSCADVSGDKKQERTSDRDTKRKLVEVKNAGVQMRDPCDNKQPPSSGRK